MTVLLLLLGCADPPPAVNADGWSASQVAALRHLRLQNLRSHSPSNRFSDDPDAAELGKALFYDSGLSPAGVACAQCHQPAHWFSDGRPLGRGVGDTARHTPGLVGMQLGEWFYWDGRADALWAQAIGPIENPNEMASDRLFVAHRALSTHHDAWERAFGPAPDLSDLPPHGSPVGAPELVAAWGGLTEEQRGRGEAVAVSALKAIEAFERQLVPTTARFDRYVDAVVAGDAAGGGALTTAEVRGLRLFIGEAGCTSCHSGPYFTDRAFHTVGVPEPRAYDAGRQVGANTVLADPFNCRGAQSDAPECRELSYLNPTFPDFQAAFKTPSLRNVAETAPYMHNGSIADLPSVVHFYSELPGAPPAGHRELTLRPLKLDVGQQADLVAFLGTLTGDPLPAELLGP
jgi:cytochrome c peroxidase